jgi:hypothetical protein
MLLEIVHLVIIVLKAQNQKCNIHVHLVPFRSILAKGNAHLAE